MNKTVRSIISALLGGAAFFIFHTLFGASLPVSILSAMAAIIGSALFLTPKKIDKRLLEIQEIYGISPGQIKKVLSSGRKKIKIMMKISRKVQNEEVRKKIEAIVDIAGKIFENFEQDPKDIKAARQFLNYYLDATLRIMERYVKLSRYESDGENSETLNKVETMMLKIEDAFQKQLTRLQDDDYLDLDTEISLLEKSIKTDGLGSENDKKEQLH